MEERICPAAVRERFRALPEIEPEREARRRARFLADYLRASGQRRLLLAVSGGVDSAVAGRLCSLAVAELRAAGEDAAAGGDRGGSGAAPDYSFLALRLPYGTQRDAADAERALEWMRPTEVATVDIAAAVRALEASLPGRETAGRPEADRDFARGNTKARMRMAAQYHLANLGGGLVVGTDHSAEALVGFFTKFGDGAADVAPLFGLSKRQVRLLARHLGAPAALVEKTPTADLEDLRPGVPDEDALGLTYREMDDWLEGRPVPAGAAERIERIHAATEHKRRGPVTPYDDWWR